MNKNVLIFAGAFLVGSLAALVLRTATHEPYTPPVTTPTDAGSNTEEETHEHGQAVPTADTQPVNSVCAICGMDVDPDLETMTYKGKVIGFGCKNCLPKFAAEPDVYGPAALGNKVVE